MKEQLTQSRLKELLHYDPETGIFTHLTSRARGRYLVGQTVNVNHSAGYRQVVLDKRHYYAHHLAFLYMTGVLPEYEVDHINGDRADNRWANLRDIVRRENTHNLGGPRTDNKSGFLGVSWHKPMKSWQARLYVNGVCHRLGYYRSPEVAHAAYLKAKDELHPTHMRLRNGR